jgi:hypothetical protein
MVPRSIVKWANLLAESGVALRATEGLFVLGIARYIYLLRRRRLERTTTAIAAAMRTGLSKRLATDQRAHQWMKACSILDFETPLVLARIAKVALESSGGKNDVRLPG